MIPRSIYVTIFNSMSKKMSLVILVLLPFVLHAQQDIKGQWYSEDSTRVYEIHLSSTQDYEASLVSTKRPGDKTGMKILEQVRKRAKGSKYVGVILATDQSGTRAIAKIRLKRNGDILQIKIRRLILLPVKIRWYRLPK